MSKKIDHSERNARARGHRDHDYRADTKRKREGAKREQERWVARVKAGRPSRSKVARKSGPVTIVSGPEAERIIADLRKRGLVD